ncbi:FecCD family ABC transporter permease [Rothia sp. CCM 9418]|uniref:FecCD family ABC transporter permease n=1 Tax=unclassified Rothia (in: high G+C Gram-positive bacteria) TaxID=2689056 RepID=UPI003AC866A4
MSSPAQTVRYTQRIRWIILFVVLSCIGIVLSILFGSHSLTLHDIWSALTGHSSGIEEKIIWEQRIPRTLLAILCGAALAVSGSLMQSLTRNPLAEPGLLGINAGASVTVVLSVIFWGVLSIGHYLIASFIGASIAAVAVYFLGQGTSRSIVRLALAGVAISAALSALNQALILSNQDAFNEFRFWVAGSLEARDMSIVYAVAPVIGVGLILAFVVTPAIHALSLGEEAAIALGVHVRRTQFLSLLAVTLLAGSATAAIGPISFVGLAVPFIVRYVLGNDVRWVTSGSALVGPLWLLLADVIARIIIAPQETQVGIIATLVGAPLFIVLMSRRKVDAL